jgi:CRISPR-associated protein Csm3
MRYPLLKKVIITGQIKAETGLAIGGSNTAMGIGGVDKGVIRNLVTNQPYIPGSSLKGKMRSLLEMTYGEIGDKPMGVVKNGPTEKDEHKAARLFGTASGTDHKDAKEKGAYQHASRVIVRDAYLSKEQDGGKSIDAFFKQTDLLYTEVKTEVVIDRITSKAMPRQMERVPAGAHFDFEIVLNIFGDENEAQLMKDVFASLQLVQNDYIGGSGSRGSGQVSFIVNSVKERSSAFYLSTADETDVTTQYEKSFPK